MRLGRSTLFLLLSGFGGVVACATTVETSIEDPPGAIAQDDASLEPPPPIGGGSSDAGLDARRDAPRDGRTDALDAAAEAWAPEGTPCSPSGATQQRGCGVCGRQSRVCLDPGTGPVWQTWGACTGEIDGGCVPGTQIPEECGNCGTRMRTCQASCQWLTGLCSEPDASACSPLDQEFVPGLSCTNANEGRHHYCLPREAGALGCTWTAWSNCTTSMPYIHSLTLPAGSTAGQTVSGEFQLSPTTRTQRVLETGYGTNLMAACPRTLETAATRYTYVGIVNATGQAARVSVFTSRSAVDGGYQYLDTVMAVYLRDTIPVTDTDRTACTGYVNDDCTRAPCSSTGYYFAGLTSGVSLDGGDDAAVNGSTVIPAGGTLIVYVAMDYSSWSGAPYYMLSARIEALQ
jgi:hypothetical protein